MKKLLLLLTVVVLIYACRKSYINEVGLTATFSGKFSVSQAREHIKALVRGELPYDGKLSIKAQLALGKQSMSLSDVPTIKSGQKIFYPFWDRAVVANYKGVADYVEVPIALSHKSIRLYGFPRDHIK